jgi:hypothetical protein
LLIAHRSLLIAHRSLLGTVVSWASLPPFIQISANYLTFLLPKPNIDENQICLCWTKEDVFMETVNNLEEIEGQIMSLTISEQIYLIERIAKRVRSLQTKPDATLNWNDLYGSGKGIWGEEDAQDYVNRSREERI